MARSKRSTPTTNTGISIQPRLLADAHKRAAKLDQSFSAYVCTLISRDLESPAIEERIRSLEKAVAELPSHYGPPKG